MDNKFDIEISYTPAHMVEIRKNARREGFFDGAIIGVVVSFLTMLAIAIH